MVGADKAAVEMAVRFGDSSLDQVQPASQPASYAACYSIYGVCVATRTGDRQCQATTG